MKKNNRIVSIIAIVILFLSFLNNKISAQCNIAASASPTSICAGEPVTLTSSGDCSYLMNNNFNNGTIGSGWASDAGPMFNNPCNPSCDGTKYLWIGPATNFPRQVTTVSYNLVCSPSKICFDMKYAEQGGSSPCEGPDLSGEGVHLQYSTNGGSSWTDINYWNPNGGHSSQYINWHNYCENLPVAAQTTNTKIRWWQSNTSGNGYDHWGLDNVEITFVPTPPESVTWSHGPTVFNPPVVHPTVTTTYTVTVSNGCAEAHKNVVVTVNPAPIVDAGQDQIVCGGGSVVIGGSPTGSGSGPTYSYAWSPSAGLSSTTIANPTANPSTITTYTVTVTSNGCSSTDNVVVAMYPNPSANAGSDHSICGGVSVVIGGSPTASGGISPYTYSWAPSLGLNSTTVANPTTSPTVTTTYTVTVTDANGCTNNDNIVVTISPGPTVDAGVDKSICNGFNTVIGGNPTASGGTSPYTYLWNPSTGLNSTTIANPTANPTATTTYTVTVTDANGCIGTGNIIITINPNPVADAGIDKSICNGFSTTIGGSPTASGGTSPYTYLWSPSTGLSSTTIANPTANPTIATTYTVIITDVNGCTDTDNVIVSVNSNSTADAGVDKSICNGNNTVIGGNPTASGGTSPYTYLWSPSTGLSSTTIANPTANPTIATTYTVTITDVNGCTGTDNIIVSINSNPTADAGVDKSICNGFSTTIGGNPTANGGSSPYTYLWSPSNTLNSATISNPTANPAVVTTYTVTITDANGCINTDNVIITIYPNPVADAGLDKSICNGNNTVIGGSSTASGGTSPYTYLWSPSTGLSSTIIANPTANPTATTNYTVTTTDANGCTDTDNIIVSISPNPTANAGPDKTICEGFNMLIGGSPTGSGSAEPYTYLWEPSADLSITTVPNPTANPTDTTTYTVTVTDANGCTNTDNMILIVNPSPNINFTCDMFNGCEPLFVNFIDNTTPNIQSYIWNFGDPNSGSNNVSIMQNPSHLFNDVGTYDITLSVTTTDGCDGIYTYQDIITVYPNPVASFYSQPEVGDIEHPNISFIDQSIDAVNWIWDFGEPSSSDNTSNIQSPVHIYSDTGTYVVWLIVKTQYGCIDSTHNDVSIKPNFTFYIPNAFTPDGDGINDYFGPKGTGIELNSFEMYIYDRWGEEIYKTNNMDEPWDGEVRKSGADAQEGVYSWLAFVKSFNGKSHKFIGHVTLVR